MVTTGVPFRLWSKPQSANTTRRWNTSWPHTVLKVEPRFSAISFRTDSKYIHILKNRYFWERNKHINTNRNDNYRQKQKSIYLEINRSLTTWQDRWCDALWVVPQYVDVALLYESRRTPWTSFFASITSQGLLYEAKQHQTPPQNKSKKSVNPHPYIWSKSP